MQQQYTLFSEVYDEFMDNVDYERWSSYIQKILQKYGIQDGLCLDLGCGTGTMTELLASLGYDMIGADSSSEMLMKALEKRDKSGHEILYLCQDMTEFELYGTVRSIVSVCDCLNYLTKEEELSKVFALVENYLDPGGIFLFDMNTRYRYETVIGETTIAETREDASFIWENSFDPKDCINESLLTLFLQREDGLFEREEESHLQRAYPQEVIEALLQRAGLTLLEEHDGYADAPVTEQTQRIVYVAQKRRGL